MRTVSIPLWQRRLQNVGLAVAIWFGSGVLAAIPLLALGVLMRAWSRMDILSLLIVGGAALVLLGPACHLLRRRPVWAVVASTLLLAAFYWITAFVLHGYLELSDVNVVTQVYSALCPFLIGAATGWLILLAYRWQGWLDSAKKS